MSTEGEAVRETGAKAVSPCLTVLTHIRRSAPDLRVFSKRVAVEKCPRVAAGMSTSGDDWISILDMSAGRDEHLGFELPQNCSVGNPRNPRQVLMSHQSVLLVEPAEDDRQGGQPIRSATAAFWCGWRKEILERADALTTELRRLRKPKHR